VFFAALSFFCGSRRQGQSQHERRALARFRFKGNLPAVFFDDRAVNKRQSLARALADGFRCEKRLENA